MSNVDKEVREAGERLGNAALILARNLELFAVTWKWMRKITGIRGC